ncbi:hypothetical protein ACLE0S_001056 [Cronobacter malonaticus]
MKLIDLLVQELPKRGGWPNGAICATQSVIDGEIYFYDHPYDGQGCMLITRGKFKLLIAQDTVSCYVGLHPIITREQYEAALTAAQQPVWDGEGLPPVGAEVEARYLHATNAEWVFFRCVAVDCETAFGWTGKEPVGLSVSDYEFRPICSEADRKREMGVIALAKACKDVVPFKYGDRLQDGELVGAAWYELYDKIAAGEVAGIRIE